MPPSIEKYKTMLNFFVAALTFITCGAAPLRGIVEKDLGFSHHKIKNFRTWNGEIILIESKSERIETSSHCANPWQGSENFKELKARYDLRSDQSVQSSDSALEGTWRARCIPVPTDSPIEHPVGASNTPLTDQCLREGECEGDECQLILADCPIRAESTPEAPRWAHSGSLAKAPDLIKVYTSPNPEAQRRCLFAKSIQDSNSNTEKKHQIPVTRSCPPKGAEVEDAFNWWLKPRTGLVGNAKFSKCLSILPESSGSKKNGPLRLRSCHFMDTPIYQSFDMYKSTHTEHETCEDILPEKTTVLNMDEIPQFLLRLSGMEERVDAIKAKADNGISSVKSALKKWVSKLKKVLPSTEKEVKKVLPSSQGHSIMPKLDISMGGSVVYGRAYGLPLNNDYYKLRASNNYRCHRLPLQAHANKRYGLLAVDVPISASVSVDVTGDGAGDVGVGARAAASMCMVWNMCAKSFAIELSSSLLISMAAGPSIGGQIAGGFGIGVSLTGELERSMDIPLWDGSRPEWIDPEFNLRDNGHFWFDYNAKLETPAEFMDPDSESSIISLELDGDLLINVAPRSFEDMTTEYRHLGDGVLLWNGHEGAQNNLLVTLDVVQMQKEYNTFTRNDVNLFGSRKDEKSLNKCADETSCLSQCQQICDHFNKECHFLSFYYDGDGAGSTKCSLYRTGNTVKAHRRSVEDLKVIGYENPSKLRSYFRDPKLIKNKLKDKVRKIPPSFTEEESEAQKSMMDSLFTVSAIGKLTLALNLRKYTFGMINLELTLAAAVAIRAGKSIPNPGIYITLDLSGENESDPRMQKKAIHQLLEAPSKVYNDVAEAANKAKDQMPTDVAPLAKDVKIEKMSAEGISQLAASGKASATAQFYFRNLRNFGFRTKTVMRTGLKHDPNALVKSTFLEMKVVDGKFMVCHSTGNAASPKCASSVLEILKLGAEWVVNIVRDFAGSVLMTVGKLVDGVIQLGEVVLKAIGAGAVALAKAAEAATKAVGKAVIKTTAKVIKESAVVVKAVAQFCTFGIFDSSKNFGTCCGGQDRGQTMPGVLFDHAIKYSWDLGEFLISFSLNLNMININ
jgi:hypothetical protein